MGNCEGAVLRGMLHAHDPPNECARYQIRMSKCSHDIYQEYGTAYVQQGSQPCDASIDVQMYM